MVKLINPHCEEQHDEAIYDPRNRLPRSLMVARNDTFKKGQRHG